MKRAIFSAVLAVMLGAGGGAKAQSSCNYNSQDAVANCADASRDYLGKVLKSDNQEQTYEGVERRVNTAGSLVRECGDCALDKTFGSKSSDNDDKDSDGQ